MNCHCNSIRLPSDQVCFPVSWWRTAMKPILWTIDDRVNDYNWSSMSNKENLSQRLATAAFAWSKQFFRHSISLTAMPRGPFKWNIFITEDISLQGVNFGVCFQRVSSTSTLGIDRLFYMPLTFANIFPFVLFQSKRGDYILMPRTNARWKEKRELSI